MKSKIVQLLCLFLLIAIWPFGILTQLEGLDWPVVGDIEFIDNPRYGGHISNSVDDLGNLLLSEGRIWQLESQTYIEFVRLGRFLCPGIFTGWSPDNMFLATVTPSLGHDCPTEGDRDKEDNPEISPMLALFETTTETITTIDLTIPDPPERGSFDYLNWSPFSPNQIAIHGYYMFDLTTEEGFVFDAPETIDLTNLNNYVFYQNGVWDIDTQLPVGSIGSGCCFRKLTICPFGETQICPVFFDVVSHNMQVAIWGRASNGHWLLWVMHRHSPLDGSSAEDGSFDVLLSPTTFEEDLCICGTFASNYLDTELYLTNLISGETRLLLRLSDIDDLLPENSSGSALFWSPDRNTVALGLVGEGWSYPGFLLITLVWGENDE